MKKETFYLLIVLRVICGEYEFTCASAHDVTYDADSTTTEKAAEDFTKKFAEEFYKGDGGVAVKEYKHEILSKLSYNFLNHML